MRDARPRRPLLSGVLLAVLLLAHAALHVAGAETCEEEGSCSKDEEKGDKDSREPAPDDTPYVCDFAEGLDFYERLGVPKDADERAIKKAFRKLSLTYHPDKVKGKIEEKECSQSHFIAITKAYETLSDEEKRRKVATRQRVHAGARTQTHTQIQHTHSHTHTHTQIRTCIPTQARTHARKYAHTKKHAHAYQHTVRPVWRH